MSLEFNSISTAISTLALAIGGLYFSIRFCTRFIVEIKNGPDVPTLSLIVQKNYVKLNGQQIQSPVAGKICITKGKLGSFLFLNGAKLELEREVQTKLSVLTKFEYKLGYLQKRKLAEKLSQYLEIPFHDELSSFGEEIYKSKKFAKRLRNKKCLELDFHETYKFQVVGKIQTICFQ